MSDLDRLIRFAAVAEDLSFSKAARRLSVDQPWLSRQIQQLESNLGVPLFVRSTRKVELTEHGARLQVHADRLVAVAEQIRGSAKEMGNLYNSTIRFGVNPYTYWFASRQELLERFRHRYKRAAVKMVANYTPRLLAKLRRRVLDVALLPAASVEDDMVSMVFNRAYVSLLVPKEDPLARAGRVHLAELDGRRFAATERKLNPALYDEQYGPLLDAGAVVIPVAEGSHALSYYARAERLMMLCQQWPDSGPRMPSDFVHVEIADPLPPIEYALVRRRDTPRPVVTQFWKVAAEVVSEVSDIQTAA